MAHSLKKFEDKYIPPESILEKVLELKKLGKTIATLNGSFDLIHAGHLYMLFEAAKQADVLIVALNTDRSIQGYKGPSRPIIPLQERLQMMAALSCVDFVTSFDEPDPRELLKLIQPNVHVNGSEYGEDCLESEVVKKGGGKIHIVPLVEGLSTSTIIKKIQGLASFSCV